MYQFSAEDFARNADEAEIVHDVEQVVIIVSARSIFSWLKPYRTQVDPKHLTMEKLLESSGASNCLSSESSR